MSLLRVSIVAMLLGAAALATAQTTAVIDVNEPRPLWKALDNLESLIGFPVNYEDPPYSNMADLETISLPGCPKCTAIVPRPVHVMAFIPMPTAGPATEGDAINDVNLLLSSYAQGSISGAFHVVQANGLIYVTPTSVLNENGMTQPISSPLMSVVNVPYARRSVGETIREIIAQVTTATGLSIAIGSSPFSPPETINFSASNISARDALAQLFSQAAPVAISYRLNFNPRPDPKRRTDYVLNIHVLQNKAKQNKAKVPPAPPSQPPSPIGRRPGLVVVNP